MIRKITVLILMVSIMSVLSSNTSARQAYVNGFSKAVSGMVWVENNFRLQADTSLLVRCLEPGSNIEWETAPLPSGYKDDNVTFIWLGGYSSGTAPEPHTFALSVNSKEVISFVTSTRKEEKEWSEQNSGVILSFRNIKTNSYADGMKDIWGYFFLTVPKSSLSNSNTRIKITGDGTGSKQWYITLQQPMLPGISIMPEKIVSKDKNGAPFQRIKVSIKHFDSPAPVKLFLEGKEAYTGEITFGDNDIYLRTDAVKTPAARIVKADIDGEITEHKVTITPVKQLTFYIIPEAHVDIGYTALQTECEKRHWDNFDHAIALAEASSGNPKGEVFKWSPEVLWALESYLENFPGKRERMIDAIKKGWINPDATYANALTGLCRPEELYRWVERARKIEKLTGMKIESAMITDIPGYTWGVIQAFADNGIKYFSVGPNTFDRIGWTLSTWGDKPFYWKSPSGNNKVLVWVAGKGYSWFHGWRLTDGNTTPIQKYIEELEKKNYPYEMVHLRYNIGGDNGYPDSLLAEFVKNWNENHITPKFVISSSKEMFTEFEKRYGSKLPEYSGDFTPYWEDGASSTAKETAVNRNTAELLTQLEILYALSGKPYPAKEFDEAWKYTLLFSEHTWGAFNSTTEPDIKFVTDQWDIKQKYCLVADSLAQKLYNDFAFGSSSSSEKVKSVSVFNTSSWKRSDVVTIPASVKTDGDFVTGEDGIETASQRLTTGELVFIARDVPALGSKKFTFSLISKNTIDNTISVINKNNGDKNSSIENSLFKISVDSTAGTFSINNKKENFNYRELNSFIHTGRKAVNPVSNGKAVVTLKEDGPVTTSLLVESDAPGCNKLSREIRIFNGLDKIDIINTIDKTKDYEKENLRFGFPFNIKNPQTRIDIAWAVIEPEKDQLKGANKNYYTVQRWADVSDNKAGITMAVVDAPLLEVGGMNAEAWITSSDEQHWATKAEPSSLLYSWVMNNSWHTNFKASQEGISSYRYSLQPHKQFDYLQAYKFGVEQSQPLLPVFNTDKPLSVFNIKEASGAVITSIRKTDNNNGYIIRLYNPAKKTASVKPAFDSSSFVLYKSNGRNEEVSKINGNITLNPFGVITLLLNKK
jgi:hypothetical protein